MSATLALPLRRQEFAEPLGMATKLTQFEIARIISDSIVASLRQAIELGCNPEQVPAIAKAIGGNAGMVVWLEALERGVADD